MRTFKDARIEYQWIFHIAVVKENLPLANYVLKNKIGILDYDDLLCYMKTFYNIENPSGVFVPYISSLGDLVPYRDSLNILKRALKRAGIEYEDN